MFKNFQMFQPNSLSLTACFFDFLFISTIFGPFLDIVLLTLRYLLLLLASRFQLNPAVCLRWSVHRIGGRFPDHFHRQGCLFSTLLFYLLSIRLATGQHISTSIRVSPHYDLYSLVKVFPLLFELSKFLPYTAEDGSGINISLKNLDSADYG